MYMTDLYHTTQMEDLFRTAALTFSERKDRAKARAILMQSQEYVIEMYICRRYKYHGPESYRRDKLYTGIELIRIVKTMLPDMADIDEENPTLDILENCIRLLNPTDIGTR